MAKKQLQCQQLGATWGRNSNKVRPFACTISSQTANLARKLWQEVGRLVRLLAACIWAIFHSRKRSIHGSLPVSVPAYHANLSDKVFLCIRAHNWHKLADPSIVWLVRIQAVTETDPPYHIGHPASPLTRAERGSQLNVRFLDKMQCSANVEPATFQRNERNNRDLIISCFVHVRFVNLCFTTSSIAAESIGWYDETMHSACISGQHFHDISYSTAFANRPRPVAIFDSGRCFIFHLNNL